MGDRRNVDDPRGGVTDQQVEQQLGKQEVAQVIHGEGALEAILGLSPRREVGANVIHQDIQPVEAVPVLLGQPPDLPLRGEVGHEELHPVVTSRSSDLAADALGLGPVAGRENDLRPLLSQYPGGNLTDPGGGPRDQDQLAFHPSIRTGHSPTVRHRSATL